MIKYYGRHGCKQFIGGKPSCFGFKIWSLNTSDGYLVNCDIYQGKQPDSNEIYEQTFGKCSAPFVKMMDKISHLKYPFKFYFDNLFTSINLLNYLREKGNSRTGTLRENRLPKKCPIITKKTMKKNERGSCASAIDRYHGIMFLTWTDNNVVTAGSTCHGVYHR
nr:unnamed protein product [Callosobruchus chinensis]